MGEVGGFGWGGVEGRGENADNCNRITIKILKKRKKERHYQLSTTMAVNKLCEKNIT